MAINNKCKKENLSDVRGLYSRIWKEFRIEELFDTKIGKAIDGNKIDRENGRSAYVTRKESNNGVDGFIDYNDDTYFNIKYPVITIGNETAEPFVQAYPFYTGTKVNILLPKQPVSIYCLLFIAQSIKMHKIKYSYSFTINSTRLRKQTVLLPSDEQGKPDYAFMEAYMKEKEDRLLRNYLA